MGIDALVEQLKTIPDWRRGRAVQHPLWLMLLLTLLEVMSGYSSLRGLADFSKIHAARSPCNPDGAPAVMGVDCLPQGGLKFVHPSHAPVQA